MMLRLKAEKEQKAAEEGKVDGRTSPMERPRKAGVIV